MNIFVGNLSYDSTEDSLRVLFEGHGEVAAVRIIRSRETGRSRGFGFVEMPKDDEGRAAIETLDGEELDGRALKVNEAHSRREGGGGGGQPRHDRRWQ